MTAEHGQKPEDESVGYINTVYYPSRTPEDLLVLLARTEKEISVACIIITKPIYRGEDGEDLILMPDDALLVELAEELDKSVPVLANTIRIKGPYTVGDGLNEATRLVAEFGDSDSIKKKRRFVKNPPINKPQITGFSGEKLEKKEELTGFQTMARMYDAGVRIPTELIIKHFIAASSQR